MRRKESVAQMLLWASFVGSEGVAAGFGAVEESRWRC